MRFSLLHRRLAIGASLMLLLVLSGLRAPPMARATDPLTISLLHCDSGASQFACDSVVSGGTGSYSASWQGTFVQYFTYAAADRSAGGCAAGRGVRMTLTVQDSAGATASRSTSFYCSAGDWP